MVLTRSSATWSFTHCWKVVRVRLTVVGCSGSGPGPTSPASSYLVEHDGFRVLLDLGNGAFGTLQTLASMTRIALNVSDFFALAAVGGECCSADSRCR